MQKKLTDPFLTAEEKSATAEQRLRDRLHVLPAPENGSCGERVNTTATATPTPTAAIASAWNSLSVSPTVQRSPAAMKRGVRGDPREHPAPKKQCGESATAVATKVAGNPLVSGTLALRRPGSTVSPGWTMNDACSDVEAPLRCTNEPTTHAANVPPPLPFRTPIACTAYPHPPHLMTGCVRHHSCAQQSCAATLAPPRHTLLATVHYRCGARRFSFFPWEHISLLQAS